MTFSYWPIELGVGEGFGRGDVLYRPFVPLHILGIDNISFVWALADTGADETVLPASMAQQLDVTLLEDATTAHTLGGKELTMQSGHLDFVLTDAAERYQWSAPVGFVDFKTPEDEIAILGHLGGLEHL